MAERWVRVVASASIADLERVINAVIDDAERHGAQLVDIKIMSTPGTGSSGHGGIGSTPAEHVALIILRSVSADGSSQQPMIT